MALLAEALIRLLARKEEDWYLSHNRDIPEMERQLIFLQRNGMREYQDRYFWQNHVGL